MPLEAISLSALTKLGVGLDRPEDVVVSRDGRVWASDKASACAEVLPDGSLRRVGNAGGEPNGINMDGDGRILIANYESGPLQRLDTETGDIEVICEEVEGRRLTASNYPIVDRRGDIWCTNSTFAEGPEAFAPDLADGFLYRLPAGGGAAELMADGIAFANGLALDEDESHIYVCQTTRMNVVRFAIHDDGSVDEQETYGPVLGERPPTDAPRPLPPEMRSRIGFTDGCGFDADGNLWVTLVFGNRVVAITPSGDVETIISDPEGDVMRAPTNVSWGGEDMRDLYIGSIQSDYILHARSPVPGLRLFHQR